MKQHPKGDGYSGRQFDHVFSKPIGRITKAWGTPKMRGPGGRVARAQIVFDLAEFGQVDVLLAFKAGIHTWTTLLQAKKDGRLGAASLAADLLLAKPLWDENGVPGSLTLALPEMGKQESTRVRYGSAFRTLREYGAACLPAGSTVGTLAQVRWPIIWQAMAHLAPASRNRVRSAVSRFLTVFLGHDKFHPARREIVRAMGNREQEPEEAKDVTVEEFWTLMDHVAEPLQPCFVTLAATGMRVGEYLSCTEASLKRFPTLKALDGKGGARDVEVAPELEPIIRQAIPCRCAPTPKRPVPVQYDARYKRLYKALRAASEATGIECTPHTLRHFYAAEGVSQINQVFVQHALGHKTPGMTARYAKRKSNREVASAVAGKLKVASL